MAETTEQTPSTTETAAQIAATRVDPMALHSHESRPYERVKGAPLYRPLRIFTQDPSASKLEGSIALINVPFEPLGPGPAGSIFEVDSFDGYQYNRPVDLNDPQVLINDGLEASPSNPQFHQQMVYAVCSMIYIAFRSALGRHVSWSFPGRLRIRPHVPNEKNAWYDKQARELCFGYYRAAPEVSGRNLPGGWVFTCLSHDIIVHECTHALLDGLRAQFTYPSGPDVPAFHEAFADLIAIFQRFSYKEVVRAAIRKSGARLDKERLLTDLAVQFAQTTSTHTQLRTALDSSTYGTSTEAHALGSVLVAAIFEAFTTIFRRKTERYIRLATGGTGILPEGDLPHDLQDILAREASQLASQFQAICIRAIDYCPPVDIEFGEYLRAIITADYDLVPDDPWAYREALIDAFSRRKIYPRWVSSFGEDALLWQAPSKPIPNAEELSYARLQFAGDPGRMADTRELERQAGALGRMVTDLRYIDAFGLVQPGDSRLNGDEVDLPCVHSIRTTRRIGPQGQMVFDLVAEVTQRRTVRRADGRPEFHFYGGSTVILGPEGEIRYTISKSVVNADRLERQRQFVSRSDARPYWAMEDGAYLPKEQLFKLLHTNSLKH
ncbi:MAG: peptidase M4 [Bryobacteraceae bacterium]